MSLLVKMLGTSSSQKQPPQKDINPAFFGYPKEAYTQHEQPQTSSFNLENLLPLLLKNPSQLSSLLSNMGENSPLSSIASIMSGLQQKKEPPSPEKEILL